MSKSVHIVWRRTGKEHGEDTGYHVNPPETIRDSLRAKMVAQRDTPEAEWRWWQLSDDLLLEVPAPGRHYNATSKIVYLPDRHLTVVSDFRFDLAERADDGQLLYWYAHIGPTVFDAELDAWVFTDHFVDVFITRNGTGCRVADLDDLAEAAGVGLIDTPTLADILRRTQALLDDIHEGRFPYPEIHQAMEEA